MNKKIENIYCIGRNYAKHAKELNNPVPKSPMVFLKSNSSIRSLDEGILGFQDPHYNYEAEIIVKVSKDTNLGVSGSWDIIDEISLGIDLTRRSVQDELKSAGHPWTLAKSFAGSALVGGFIPKDQFPDLNSIQFSFTLNDKIRQQGDSLDMVFDIPSILTFLLTFTDLKAGDIIFTGTPEGVGKISTGDQFKLKFDQINREMSGIL